MALLGHNKMIISWLNCLFNFVFVNAVDVAFVRVAVKFLYNNW